MYLKYRKGIKFTNRLIKHVNAFKNLITILNCQLSNLTAILKYIINSYLDFLLNNNKKDNSLRTLHNNKKKIRPANINNKKENIRPANINK